jgi:PPOX class probable F420-dependent enzyme
MAIVRSVTAVPSAFEALLASKALLSLATLGPDGSPQNNPVWFIWDGTTLRFAVQPHVQKLKNVRRDARIAATLADPANPERYIEFRGTVTTEPDTDQALGNALARKYLDLDALPWAKPGDGRQAVTVVANRILVRE